MFCGESSVIILYSANRHGFGRQVAELSEVHFHAIIKVEADFLIGGVLEFFLEDEQFCQLLLELVLFLLEFLAMVGAGCLGKN